MRARSISLLLLLACAVLSGCATPLYDWGGYDKLLYDQYKDPSTATTMRESLQEHIKSLEQNNAKVAPGLYAELGTLYLKGGDKPRALALYEKEAVAWPESKPLMSTLIKNLDRPARGKPKKGNNKKAADKS